MTLICFYSGDNLTQLQEEINTEMNKLKLWFDRNRLSLNVTKTKFVLFDNSRSNTQIKIKIDGVEIERVKEIKFLGVTIDEKLNWKSHIKHVQSKVSRSIAVINKAKRILDKKSLHTLYCSLVLPYFQYCIEVWGNNYKTSLNAITCLQKRAIRIINNVGYLEHTNSLFLQSKLLKFADIVQYQTAQIMFKAKNLLLPKNIQKLFEEQEGDHYLRSKEQGNIKVHYRRTTGRSLFITNSGVELWNSLTVELKRCVNMKHFKINFKDMIFKKYSAEAGAGHH